MSEMSSNIGIVRRRTIFREYIGVKPYGLHDFPAHIINPNISEFHFILGFASEDYDQHGRGTGHFKPTWNLDYFSPEKITKLKRTHPNVKVVITIGGRGNEYPFNPAEKQVWVYKAIASLVKILISDYKHIIDGIDINYEVIKCSEAEFADCIGKLIIGLKNDVVMMNVVSIAPSNPVQSHYKRLYKDHEALIDWVDYQFYDQLVSTKNGFIWIYRALSNYYSINKLLAGFRTGPHDEGNISLEVFIEGCKELIKWSSLAGIFVWNANDSATSNPPFLVEEMLQNILTDGTPLFPPVPVEEKLQNIVTQSDI